MFITLPDPEKMEGEYYERYKTGMLQASPDQTLYRIFWEPIQKQLSGVHKTYLLPAGIYYRVNVNTLPLPGAGGQFLIDQMDIHLINSIHNIQEDQRQQSPGRLALLVGNPTFDEAAASDDQITDMSFRSAGEQEFLVGKQWDPLPGTAIEIERVGNVLSNQGYKVQKLVKAAAREDAIFYYPSPFILHLATYGFYQFLDFTFIYRLAVSGEPSINKTISTLRARMNLDMIVRDTSKMTDEDNTSWALGQGSILTIPRDLDLTLRSGIVLAGAGYFSKAKEKLGVSDGILTGYDLSRLDLSGTELVVFSACETGLGQLGLYCQIAGARSLISSLWPVRDEVTQEFMTTFYTYWIKDKMSKRAAFRQAQFDLRKLHLEPYYWGGFTIIGY